MEEGRRKWVEGEERDRGRREEHAKESNEEVLKMCGSSGREMG